MEPVEVKTSTTRTSLELLYHISRELAAAFDLNTVLERVLLLSMQNLGATSGSIIVLDDKGKPLESALVIGETVHEHTTKQLTLTFEQGLAGWVGRHRQPVLIPDTSQDERWLVRPDDAPEGTGSKSAVGVPIQARDRLVGVMTLVHPWPGFFTEEHVSLLQSIVDQAGIAILNARLFEESQRQARIKTAIAESAKAITGSLDLDDVLQNILTQISQALRVDGVCLALVTADRQELEFWAATGREKNRLVGMRIPFGVGVAGWVAQHGEGVIVPDAYHDHRFYSGVDHVLDFRTEAIACVPVRSQGEIIGVIEAINPQGGAFDPDALTFLNGVSSLAGTAIRHAQLFERLQTAHQRYREIFDASIDILLVTDLSGIILESNRQAQELLGPAMSSAKGRQIFNLHQVYDREKIDLEKLASGDTLAYEAELCRPSGRKIPVQVYVREVEIDGVPHLQWLLRDISERRDLDALREDMLSMVYHDLRSPLANIVSSLDVIASMLPANEDHAIRPLLGIAVRSAERIRRLTNSMLDISRLEAGQSIGFRQSFRPFDLIKDAVDEVLPLAQHRCQSIDLDVDPDLPDVSVDGDMIRRVLINLMENAVKFTPPEGKIKVGSCRSNGVVEFWIHDSGPGIPPEEYRRIFEKFTRLPSANGAKGLGLGLAYCRLAVEAHGGAIWVQSGQERGSKFIFTMPLA